MPELIAYCGLNCGECEAYHATQKDDKEEFAKIAADWSERYGGDTKPEDVICDGCSTPSERKNSHYYKCNIRICAQEKGNDTCASCEEYICEKLERFFKEAPKAKETLEGMKKQ